MVRPYSRRASSRISATVDTATNFVSRLICQYLRCENYQTYSAYENTAEGGWCGTIHEITMRYVSRYDTIRYVSRYFVDAQTNTLSG